jgi:cyclopropane fatty-acyl-phospholipid synthase-like methyltransferase
MMGPNVLWLTEALTQVMDLKPGMQVLDMGCGRAISSIFLAKEFDVQVWAADLWIKPTPNWERIRDAGVEKQVFPIDAEAHALPFADDFFDAIVSMDSYHYYGTEDRYMGGYFARLVKPGGQIGIVVPGLVKEIESNEPPEHLQSNWVWDFWTFHSPEWWRRHWERSGIMAIEVADMVPDGWKLWRDSDQIRGEWNVEQGDEAEMLRVDAGRNLGFTRVVARRSEEERWRG